VPLANDFRAALEGLSDDWAEARFALRVRNEEEEAARAAALLGVLNPVHHGNTVWFVTRRGGGVDSPDAVARTLTRLDRDRVHGELELVESATAKAETAPEAQRTSLAAAWDDALAALPPDWTDIFAEVELTSTDHLDQGALLLSPLNPSRDGDRVALRFRSARRFGYGAAPEMVRRCLERLEEHRIVGEVRILDVLSDTKPWATQGPVRVLGGKHV